MTRMSIAAAAGVLFLSGAARAHQPIFPEGAHSDPANAVEIEDPTLSQVVYSELSPSAPQLWLTFELEAGQELYVQLGVPAIDRLEGYRPSVAVVGPGLPHASLPFAAPANTGAVVFPAGDEPELFYEPFTGTESWIRREELVTVSQAGRYYAVAFSPTGQTGKLWVAVGRREEFGLDEIASFGEVLNRVREFHELPEGSSPPCFLIPMAVALSILGLCRSRWARGR
ncbi:MAG: hypothetical protein AMXMBFR13_41510 [Phycisphaerae bacterium]